VLGYIVVGLGGVLVGCLLMMGAAEVIEIRELRRLARERKQP